MILDSLAYGLGGSLLKNLNKPYPWFVFVGFLLLGFVYRAWRNRIRCGDYEFSIKDSELLFESEIGKFSLNKEKKSFSADYGKNGQITLSFDDIRNIEIVTEDVDALFSQLTFEHFDPLINTSFLGSSQYTDVFEKYSIAVVTKNFKRYPLIAASQYTFKEPSYMMWGLQMQLDLLSLIGLYTPIDMRFDDIYLKFKMFLGEFFDFDKNKRGGPMKRILILVILAFSISSIAVASEIILKSGEKIEGKVIEQTDKYITIEPNIGPIKTYHADEIDSISDPSASQSPQDQQTSTSSPTEVAQQPESNQPSESVANQFVQKDGLFKLSIPDGWSSQEASGRVLILPPPPKGNGIVIQYNSDAGAGTPEQIKEKISTTLNNIADYKIKPMGGNVIENKEMTIDGVPAQYLLYSVTLKGDNMYFVRVMFDNKGYIFSIDYGDPDRAEVEKAINLLNTWRF